MRALRTFANSPKAGLKAGLHDGHLAGRTRVMRLRQIKIRPRLPPEFWRSLKNQDE
jgi:hypothetical protein